MGILINGNKPSKIIYNGAEPSLYYNGSKIWPESSPTPAYVGYMVEMIWGDNNAHLITTGPASTKPTKINNVAITQSDLPSYCCRYIDTYNSWSTMSNSDYNSLFNGGLTLNTKSIRLYYPNTPASFTFSWYNTQRLWGSLIVNVYKWTDFDNITLASTNSIMMDQASYKSVTATLQ